MDEFMNYDEVTEWKEKENFWNELFHLVSCIPQNETIVLAGDINGHLGSNSVGYNGTHGGYRFGDRNADVSRILEFADGLNLAICNTLFMKQESKLPKVQLTILW